MIGSSSFCTSCCILASRAIKFAAQVSSSIRSTRAPISSASTMLAACDVLPLAFAVENLLVSFPPGRSPTKIEISTADTLLPLYARTFTVPLSAAQRSRPSPERWL